ncbi:helix-turn-helix transcriptional regulator [Dictyobacter aurantiacus]|uniref:Transcriptional regulator n=1 Tax=Dictyobacter aurantiacus TaxID=1936993 RepID=A0A401ZJX4_9CHLR|nr:helix-turn-helix transcriptional regulator [Dictyobacter aurantiacus]GCE07124.1 transcriptional regulator [Dictyobacter aurantiacus]
MIDEAQRRAQLADFLKTRRARLSPQQFGLPVVSRRRTPGLRRDEVALLAGIGVSWYTWLEQGRPITVSDQVLDSLTSALRLDDSERRHLYMLARGMLPVAGDEEPQVIDQPPINLLAVMDALGNSPAYILDRYLNVVAWNASAARLFGDFGQLAGRDRNVMWRLFTHSSQRTLYVQWEEAARHAIKTFRTISDQLAGDAHCEQLIADLKQASPDFRRWWTQHDIELSCSPTHQKEFNHPQVGRLEVLSTTLISPDNPHFRLVTLTPCTPDTTARLVQLARVEGRRYSLI